MTYDVIEKARRTTRRSIIIAVPGVLALLAGMVVAVVFLARHDHDRNEAGASTVDSSMSTVPTAGPVLPDDLAWTEVAGVALPVSPTAGPRDVRAGRARGFAHTHAGAVLAAVHLLVRTAPQVGSDVFGPTIAEQVVGVDAARMRDQVSAAYERLRDMAQVPDGQPIGPLPAMLRGYRVDSYTPDEAVLSQLTEALDATGARRYAATQVRMRWTGTDWALVAPDGGTWDSAVLIVTPEQAATFTTFPAGR